MTPISKPMPVPTVTLSKVILAVNGKALAITPSTGSRNLTERPKSPCAKLRRKMTYCSNTGRSRPSLRRIISTCSGEARSPAISLAGSPGSATRSITKTTVVTARIKGKAINMRHAGECTCSKLNTPRKTLGVRASPRLAPTFTLSFVTVRPRRHRPSPLADPSVPPSTDAQLDALPHCDGSRVGDGDSPTPSRSTRSNTGSWYPDECANSSIQRVRPSAPAVPPGRPRARPR